MIKGTATIGRRVQSDGSWDVFQETTRESCILSTAWMETECDVNGFFIPRRPQRNVINKNWAAEPPDPTEIGSTVSDRRGFKSCPQSITIYWAAVPPNPTDIYLIEKNHGGIGPPRRTFVQQILHNGTLWQPNIKNIRGFKSPTNVRAQWRNRSRCD